MRIFRHSNRCARDALAPAPAVSFTRRRACNESRRKLHRFETLPPMLLSRRDIQTPVIRNSFELHPRTFSYSLVKGTRIIPCLAITLAAILSVFLCAPSSRGLRKRRGSRSDSHRRIGGEETTGFSAIRKRATLQPSDRYTFVPAMLAHTLRTLLDDPATSGTRLLRLHFVSSRVLMS